MLGTLIIAAAILALLSPYLKKYWDGIKSWLLNEGANLIEQALGYNARRVLLRVVSTADKVFSIVSGVRVATNTAVEFWKESDNTIKKVTMYNDIPADKLGQEYLDEMRMANNVVEMDYRQ